MLMDLELVETSLHRLAFVIALRSKLIPATTKIIYVNLIILRKYIIEKYITNLTSLS